MTFYRIFNTHRTTGYVCTVPTQWLARLVARMLSGPNSAFHDYLTTHDYDTWGM